jgi:hypothetical protein
MVAFTDDSADQISTQYFKINVSLHDGFSAAIMVVKIP